MAACYAGVAEEKRQKNEMMPAAFGEEVWVPKRSWKRLRDPFGPTYEKARYLAVVKEVTSGHGVRREDGKIEVVSRIVRGVVEPEDRLLPEEGDPRQPRRRIRGKTNAGEERGRPPDVAGDSDDKKEALDQTVGDALGITAAKIKEMKATQEALMEEIMGTEEKQVVQVEVWDQRAGVCHFGS